MSFDRNLLIHLKAESKAKGVRSILDSALAFDIATPEQLHRNFVKTLNVEAAAALGELVL
jgi:hypothetical protein